MISHGAAEERRALGDNLAELHLGPFVVLIAKNDGDADAYSKPAAHRTTISART